MTHHRLLIVCTANICRSPMAHALAEDYSRRRGWGVEVRSGGTLGLKEMPPANHAISVMKELGIDISNHRCQGITKDDVQWADYILVMTLEHSSELRHRFPESDSKLLQLASFGGMTEISDPYRSWKWRFRKTRNLLNNCIINFIDQLPPKPLV